MKATIYGSYTRNNKKKYLISICFISANNKKYFYLILKILSDDFLIENKHCRQLVLG